jgi:hypothetical protein
MLFQKDSQQKVSADNDNALKSAFSTYKWYVMACMMA